MFAQQQVNTATGSERRQWPPQRESEADRFLDLGRRHGWRFSVLGTGPIPKEPVRLGDWLVVSVEQDSTQVPERAWERVQAIYAAGLRPQGFVMVHEAPDKVLPAPQIDDSEIAALPFRPEDQLVPQLKRLAAVIAPILLGAIALAGAAVLALAAIAAVAILLAPFALVAGALTLDPILVAITEEGDWIEIDRWDS